MKIIAATTFSINGYNEYAHRLINTFIKHWPKEVTLYAYYDDVPPGGWRDTADNVVYIKLDDPELTAFKQRNIKNPKQSGNGTNSDFLHDGIRFSHKVFAYIDAAMNRGADIAVWLDGDSITHRKLPMEVITSWLSGKMAGALLRPWQYTETGFHVFDMRHPRSREFMEAWKSYYVSDRIWNLQHYTDCHTYDATMATFPRELWHDLSPAIKHSHPFINGVLGEYMDHAKGPRKAQGHSKASDLVINRSEDHWAKVKSQSTQRNQR